MNHFDIVRAAYYLHRRQPEHRELVTLPAPDIAHMLGRKCPERTRAYQYTAHGQDGAKSNHVTCGLETIWRTGGRDVCRLVLHIARIEELDEMDYQEEVIWRSHVRFQAAQGYHIPRNLGPHVWRFGKKLSPDDHQMLLDRLDAKHGYLTRYLPGNLDRWRQHP